MLKQLFHCLIGLIGAFVIESTKAATFSLPLEGDVVGATQIVVMKRGENLFQLAQRYDIGVAEISKANPKLKLWAKYKQDREVVIPSQYILPSGPRQGIVLNLAELRIYYFHPDEPKVSTYPVAIGKQGWSTPQGVTEIKAKEKNPAWRPTRSIHREAARRGKMLPLIVPPGPRNPLGRYAMRLGISGIMIHGTTQPATIGLRCSHGCIRMYPKNIEQLFQQVSIGTGVRIVDEPKKRVSPNPEPQGQGL